MTSGTHFRLYFDDGHFLSHHCTREGAVLECQVHQQHGDSPSIVECWGEYDPYSGDITHHDGSVYRTSVYRPETLPWSVSQPVFVRTGEGR